ncbi:MAG: DMT family transporter [Rhodospirillales bacterium]|nr:DMT family transporter [Rhodospirillales bacterium]
MLILIAYVLLAIMDATSKYLVGSYHFTQIMAVRFWVFFVISLFTVRRTGILASFKSSFVFVQIIRALILIAEVSLIIFSFGRLPLADVHAVLTAAPLFVLILAGWTLGETIGFRGWISVLAGFSGAVLIIRPGFSDVSGYLVLPLIAALLWAVYQILSRLVSRRDTAETTLMYTTLICMLAFSAMAPFHWVWPQGFDWVLLLFVALLGAASHFCIIKAFTFTPASLLQPYSYSLFLWAIVLGYLVFGDVPDLPTVIGGAIIIAAGIYASDRDGTLWARLRGRIGLGP